MTTVVTDNCQRCRYTDCVVVCPVSCFHGDQAMLYIDPEICIDCSACVPECPVQAIYHVDDLPPHLFSWVAINAERARSTPVVETKQPPLPDADLHKAKLGF
jgi:ferredoxin